MDHALRAFERLGEGAFAALAGEWSWIVWNPESRSLLVARDPVGERGVYFHRSPRRILVASDVHAILADPSVSRELDRSTVAAFFAIREPARDRTFFRDIEQLPPGWILEADDHGSVTRPFWLAPEHPEPFEVSDEEAVARYSELLEEAVAERLDDHSPAAVMMSGGLDSTAVAAAAARISDRRVRVSSWCFRELQDSDESEFTDAMVESFGFEAFPIDADDLWTLKDPEAWTFAADSPFLNLFRLPAEASYRALAAAGSRVVLTGEYGDELYLGSGRTWPIELVQRGRAGELFAAAPTRSKALRWLLSALLWRYLPALRRSRARDPGRWLTPAALEQLEPPGVASAGDRLDRMLSPWTHLLAGQARRTAYPWGAEVRHPYRDLELMVFMSRLPDHLLRRGLKKWILREAMQGRLPEVVRLRTRPSSLMPLYLRGVLDRELGFVRRVLTADPSVWGRWVRRDWLFGELRRNYSRPLDTPPWLLLWRCLSFRLWAERHGYDAEP